MDDDTGDLFSAAIKEAETFGFVKARAVDTSDVQHGDLDAAESAVRASLARIRALVEAGDALQAARLAIVAAGLRAWPSSRTESAARNDAVYAAADRIAAALDGLTDDDRRVLGMDSPA